MLDNEPTNADTRSTPAASAPATPRRRRAASRPAGPPSHNEPVAIPATAAPVDPVAVDPDSAAPPAEAPPAATTRPARKRATKKAAAAPPSTDTSTEGGTASATVSPAEPVIPADAEGAAVSPERAVSPEPAVRPARKRATRKAGAPAAVPPVEAAPVEAAPVVPTVDAEPITELAASESAVNEPTEPTEPTTRTRSRRRGLVRNPFEVPEIASLAEPASEPTAESEIADEEEAAVTEAEAAAAQAAADVTETNDAGAPETTDDADADADESDDDATDEGDDESGDQPRRRRRRRGGRRRRRGGADDEASDADDAPDSAGRGSETGSDSADDTGSEPSDTDSDDESGGDADTGEGGTRRRRRRRRRGEDTAGAEDDPSNTVVKVREPRGRRSGGGTAASEITGIEGSTRVEAKRQRRREGRDSGRRRAPILSEAEFLTRRESVKRTMVIRQRPGHPDQPDLTQIAVLEDGVLVEHYVDQDSGQSIIGNVYLGRVQNVLPSMEAAFIDIGKGRNAVLYAGEVDWDSFGAHGDGRRVEQVLKSGQTILVQVTKDPIGAKGARLTNHVSIPGRYIVYSPGGHLSGISRKLPENERKRLKDILSDLIDENASVIVRTAAEGASEDELVRDVTRLKAQWEDIAKKLKASGPQLLYGEPDLTVRIVRDLFTEDFAELLIDGNGSMSDAYDAIDGYVRHVAPHLAERMKRWDGAEHDVFHEFRVDEQIAKALERKVHLPSGGSLVIDRTEAMTVVDVNTGKFTGSAGNLEATVTSNNLEAAEEIVRQLRLRDIGGIIVIDFIDMVLPVNRELLLRRLVECLGRDRTRHQVAEVTSLGLVQMTRKRIGTGLLEAFSTECPHCHGRGVEVHDLPIEKHDGGDDRDRGRGGNGGGPNSGGNGGGGVGGGGRSKRSGRSGSSNQGSNHRSRSVGASNGSNDSAGDADQQGDQHDDHDRTSTPAQQPIPVPAAQPTEQTAEQNEG